MEGPPGIIICVLYIRWVIIIRYVDHLLPNTMPRVPSARVPSYPARHRIALMASIIGNRIEWAATQGVTIETVNACVIIAADVAGIVRQDAIGVAIASLGGTEAFEWVGSGKLFYV